MHLSHFLTYLPVSIATSVVVYLIGHICYLCVNQNKANQGKLFFYKLISGLIAIVTAFAIITTSGISYLIGLLFLGVFLIYYFRKKDVFVFQIDRKKLFSFEFCEFAYFLVYLSASLLLLLFTFREEQNHTVLMYDYSYYSAIVNNMLSNNVETMGLSKCLPGSEFDSVPYFYHYFELWFAGFVKFLFGIKAFYALVLVVMPIFFASLLSAAKLLIHKLLPNANPILRWILPFVVLLISSNASLFNSLFFQNDTLTNNLLISDSQIKLSIVYICVMWFFLNIDRPLFEKLIPLSLMCFLYPPTMPVIFSGSGLYLALVFVFKNKSFCWKSFFLVLIPGVYMVGFYAMHPPLPPNPCYDSMITVLAQKLSGYSFSDLKMFVTELLSLYGMYVIYAILAIVIFKQIVQQNVISRKSIIQAGILLGSMFVTSSFVYAIMHGIIDAGQMQTNFINPVLNVSVFGMLMFLLRDKKMRFVFSLFLVVSIVNISVHIYDSNIVVEIYDKKETEILKNEFQGRTFSSVYIKNNESYTSVNDRNINWIIPYPYLRQYSDSYYPVCLSVYEIPEPKSNFEALFGSDLIYYSPFYQYVKNSGSKSNDILKKSFIEKHKIDYLFIEKKNPFTSLLHDLPVTKTLRFENNPFEIIRFDWK
ncbi:MAG: hypothetical protein KKA07_12910 [Bacteroidetes bacterium]|nr:hypothetical protein [Bacteroidota bacterium]MBU1719958.1 hypothetical protein [Bacteroidota bacterium]